MLSKTVKELFSTNIGQIEEIRGWIRTKRDTKELSFIDLNDGSTPLNFQIILGESLQNHPNFKLLTTGSSAFFKGIIQKSEGQEQSIELLASEFRVLGPAPADTYPLQKKRHSFEFLRDIAHLRPRTNTFASIARVRNALSFAIHEYFQTRQFYWVHTPIITTSDAEGAGEMFQVTTLDLEKIKGIPNYEADFFGKKAHLTVSGQLEGEIMASAMGRIYTFGPTFRAENSNTSRHLAEFWMIEPEVAFHDIHDNMDLAEDFLKFVINTALSKVPNDFDFFNERIQPGIIGQLQELTQKKFARITYTEAIALLEKESGKFEYPISWGKDLQSEHEKFLSEQIYASPVMVTGYPKEIKAFYMKLNEDGKTVRAMDVLVPRLGEIIGGSEREENLDTLIETIKRNKLNPEDYWWYLELRKFGSVPHAGFGLGFERLVQYVTGMQNIRDVIPFPRAPKLADF